jgi:cell division septum initiation protein DivIVA
MSHALSAARRTVDYVRQLERANRRLERELKQLRASLATERDIASTLERAATIALTGHDLPQDFRTETR